MTIFILLCFKLFLNIKIFVGCCIEVVQNISYIVYRIFIAICDHYG